MTAIISCVGLTKTYPNGVTALDDLTLTIEEGMSFGLMGENGAGKSTLVRLLMGFIFPTRSSLNILGESDARRAHPRVGYLHERPYVELRFTGRRYLGYLAELSGLWGSANRQRVSSVLEQVDLAALFFPFLENVSYFYGTSTWDLSAIAVLGTTVMARQASIARLPLIPVGICYNIGVNSSLDTSVLPGFLLIALYIAGLVWLAGYWLERRELLLH